MFASEVKAILAYRGVAARLSLPALMEYMTFQNVVGEHTLFDGVTMMPPGTTTRVARDGTTRRRTYFDPMPIASDERLAIWTRSSSSSEQCCNEPSTVS